MDLHSNWRLTHLFKERKSGSRRALLFVRPRWRKVLRDLWLNKARTLLVLLSIAVGVFAVGAIAGSRLVLTKELAALYAATNPSDATIYTVLPFSEADIKAIADLPEVADATGRQSTFIHVKTDGEAWQRSWLIAMPDYENMGLDKIRPVAGSWPPGEREILIERSALAVLDVKIGDTVLVRGSSGREKELVVGGIVHDMLARLFVLEGSGYAYVSRDTLDWLGESTDFRELRFTVAENGRDRAHIQQVANQVQDRLERSGNSVYFTLVPNPGQHPMQYAIDAAAILLGALGILALLLSGFLVINTITALLAQQVRQIGLMKAFGGRSDQIMVMYLLTAAAYGVLTLVIALPLGAFGASFFTSFLADFFNFDVPRFYMPLEAILLQAAIALLLPIFVSFYPILQTTRISTHEAINDYGVAGAFGRSRFDHWLLLGTNLRWVNRPLLMSLRNTFRRKSRLLFTLLTLTLSGAIFMATFSVQASLLRTIDDMLAYFQYDVSVQFHRPYRNEVLAREAWQIPGVATVEGWGFYNSRLVHADGTHSANIMLFAPPADTQLVQPSLEAGRWLRPDDENAAVVNTILLRDEPQLNIGDPLTLKIKGQETTWTIVGIVQGGQMIGTAYVNYDPYVRIVGEVDQSGWLMVGLDRPDPARQLAVKEELHQRYETRGLDVNVTSTVGEERANIKAIFQVIVALLLAMSALLAVVGGLGLAGTMSINILERTREIGIMRAIGAGNRSLYTIFMTEGILIGLLSWLLAILIAWPVSWALSEAVGRQFLGMPLSYSFSVQGFSIWFAAVLILAAAASFWPAWNAARLTVQDVLAYE